MMKYLNGVFFLCSALVCSSYQISLEDSVLLARTKRGAPGAIRTLLQKANLVYPGKQTSVYLRRGGYRQALKDFTELKPTNVDDFGSSKWGDVDDRTIMLQMDTVSGRASISVLDSKAIPDGSVQRIVDNILYVDGSDRQLFPVSKN